MKQILLALTLIITLTACGKDNLVVGPKGDKGDTGLNGSNGAAGSVGATGPQGVPGTPGTQIGAIQLCPGTTVYPSSFPEQAICIENKLYAVYWSGSQAFLSYLAPGAYSSTSNSVSCNFTVVSGCTIQN